MGQSVVLSSDQTQQASAQLLPITWSGSFRGVGLEPGSLVFLGQYLFTGAETTSAYLTVCQVGERGWWGFQCGLAPDMVVGQWVCVEPVLSFMD